MICYPQKFQLHYLDGITQSLIYSPPPELDAPEIITFTYICSLTQFISKSYLSFKERTANDKTNYPPVRISTKKWVFIPQQNVKQFSGKKRRSADCRGGEGGRFSSRPREISPNLGQLPAHGILWRAALPRRAARASEDPRRIAGAELRASEQL